MDKSAYASSYFVPKLLIVDGSNLLFQMFFGMPSRIVNKNNKAIHGTLGFVGALLKIIKMVTPTHIIVIFDGEHENTRMQLDNDYKANRIDYATVAENENPYSQLPDIYTALDFLAICHYETETYEADDGIASYALQYQETATIVISSFDSDFFQLINDRVSVLRYRGEKTILCDSSAIQNKLGILPQQYAEFKSLTGDKADNIIGAERVGIKTAAQLLRQFGSLQNIIDNADEITKLSIRESIKRNESLLWRNYQLIKLDDRAELPFLFEALAYQYNGITTTEVLTGIGLKP